MSRLVPLSGTWADDWDAPVHGQPPLGYGDAREPLSRPDLVGVNERDSFGGMPPRTAVRRSSMAEYMHSGTATLAFEKGQEGRAYAHGPRRSSSFGTVFSSRPFAREPPGSVAHAESATMSSHGAYPVHSRAVSAALAPELHSSLLPSAVIADTPLDFGACRDSLDGGLWASRTTWTAEQNAYRDVEDPLALEELATEILSRTPLPQNSFSPHSFDPPQSTSTYSTSSSASRSTAASLYLDSRVGASPPVTTPRSINGTRRRSTISEPESASPSKRTSPRKVATVTTTFDAKGSPTKSIRRISKLNLDASPSSRSPSVSPRKGARRPPPRIAPAIAPKARDSEEASGRTRSGRRVSFGAVEHAPVPSVLLPPDPTRFSLSSMSFAPDDFALLDEVTLLPGDVLPVPPATAPSWLESFELPTPPDQFYRPSTDSESVGGHSNWPSIYLDEPAPSPSVSSFTLPANPHARAHSAHAEEPASSRASGLAVPAATYPPLASPAARRRSSTASYDYVPVSSQRYPVPASPWHSGFPTNYTHDPRPQPLHQPPTTFKLPAYGSSSASSASPSPVSDSRPVTPPPIAAPAPIVIATGEGGGGGGYPARAISSPIRKSPASPKKKRSPAKSKRQPGAMFVNYSSQDANKLLKGVAPSGSTRKRREEEEARRQAAIEARTRSTPTGQSATDPHPL
ncbi:hypothetical protein JCM3774_001928 [Rhodotorula dairenensis]